MDLKSNEPFWLVKNGIITSYPSLKEDTSCDVLVVGGGITGSIIAHQCIKEGYKTILIDKREIANGSSSATTSMLQYEIDTPLYKLIDMIGKEEAIKAYKSCADAIKKLKEVTNEIKSKAGFKNKKSLYFAAYKKDIAWLKKEYEVRKEAGFKVKWLSAHEIHEKYQLSNTHGAILSNIGASVDAFRLVHEILDYNIKKGLKVYDRTALNSVEYHKGYTNCLISNDFNIKTKKIIYCVGYESQTMIKEKFVNLISTYAIVSEINKKLAKQFDDILIWNTASPYIYIRTTADKRLLIGGEDEEFYNPKKRDDILDKKETRLVNSFNNLLPEEKFYVDFTWAGTFGETKDGLPYIGEHPDFPSSYFVLGFGGNGITFSVTGMEMISAWLKNKKHELAQIFQFGR